MHIVKKGGMRKGHGTISHKQPIPVSHRSELWPAAADIRTNFDGVASDREFEAISSYARSNGVQVRKSRFEDVSLDSFPGFVSPQHSSIETECSEY